MKFLCRKSRKENFPRSLRKLFCDLYQHLRATCQIQHADHFERGKTKFSFYIIFLIEYSWEPCSMFSMECGVFSPNRELIHFHIVSCVVQWKANVRVLVFIHSTRRLNISFFCEKHSLLTCSVFNIKQCKQTKKKETSGNSHQTSEERKNFSDSQRISKLLSCFTLSLHSLSVVCEHFIDLEQPNGICCSSRQCSFPHSLYTIFSSCKSVHNVNQLKAGWGRFCVRKKNQKRKKTL